MTLKDYILATLIMCVIDVIIMLALDFCNITINHTTAFICGIAVGIAVLRVYSEVKNK